MAYYLSICNDENKKEFLLISEQHIDGKIPEIKAQIYFEAPINNLKECEIHGATYAISKKEVEILLNLALKRESYGFRSTGLFADGKVNKQDPFNVFGYPCAQSLDKLLKALNIKQPKAEIFVQHKVEPDKEHILNKKHHISWDNYIELECRTNTDFKNWTENEIVETKLLDQFNMLQLVLQKYI